MKSNLDERFSEERANLCALFMDFAAEAELNARLERKTRQYYSGYLAVNLWGGIVFSYAANHMLDCGYGDMTAYLQHVGARRAAGRQRDRYAAWADRQDRLRRTASVRLRTRLEIADQQSRKYDPTSAAQAYKRTADMLRVGRPELFDVLAALMRDTVKAEKREHFAGVRDGKLALVALSRPHNEIVRTAVAKRWPKLVEALKVADMRFDTGAWTPPVWDNERWADKYPHHYAHASKETKGNIAFYPDAAKMEADKLTSMKPGRYLATFFSEELDAEAIKHYANAQQHAQDAPTLKFIDNTDPDGWEWVYENSAPSCMRYNRSNRYLDIRLYGKDHPVRAYAHPSNSLALAYVMVPGEVEDRDVSCPMNDYVVAARTIVNTNAKTYLRIYADDDRYRTLLHNALDNAGYRHSSGTLDNQRLVRRTTDDGETICPYLDGSYTDVETYRDYMIVGDGGDDGQQSSGVLAGDRDRCHCAWCDGYYNEDDGWYIESVHEWVCESCTNDNFVYAYARRGNQELYPEDDDYVTYCEYNGNYYHTDYLDDNDMSYDYNGELYPSYKLVSTSQGLTLRDETEKLTYPYEGDDYAGTEDVHTLPNGETCHVDDEDTIAYFGQQQEAA